MSAHIAFLLTLGLSIYVWAWGSVRAGFEPFFTNVTRASGFDFTHFNGMSGEFYLPEIMGPGVALMDYDGDGDLDLFLVQGTMLGPARGLRTLPNEPP